MQILQKKLSEIKPYENNPRKNKEAVPKVAASIREFGFRSPIIVDKDMVIICGHTRYAAAKRLGLKEVPVEVADDLTEEQVRAYRLADNKVSEAAEWDLDLLGIEMDAIDGLDLGEFGFDLSLDEEEPKSEEKEPEWGYYGDSKERDARAMKLDYLNDRITPRWQMPVIRATHHYPTNLIEFAKMQRSEKYDHGVHFFEYDYQFERIWTQPDIYLPKLAKFDCCFTPDFSMYTEMPLPMMIWNNYRGKLIGQIMQDYGITVIPTLQWCWESTFEFCFDGLEPGGVYATSTVGCKKGDARNIYQAGLSEAIRQLEPEGLIVYGGTGDFDFHGVKTVVMGNKNTEGYK